MLVSPDFIKKPNFNSELTEAIKTRFGFDSNKPHPFFDNKPEPLSDDLNLLKIVLKRLPKHSKVLSIPTHLHCYRGLDFDVELFDISPGQIMFFADKSGYRKIYWCDIFTPAALESLLTQVMPNIIDISNIQEWAPINNNSTRESQEQFIRQISNHSTIKYLIFSSPFSGTGDKANFTFINLLTQFSWTVETHQSKVQNVYDVGTNNHYSNIYLATKN